MHCLQLHFNYLVQATQLQKHCINIKNAVTVDNHAASTLLLSHITHFRAHTEVRVVTVVRFTTPNLRTIPTKCTHVHCTVRRVENDISSKQHYYRLEMYFSGVGIYFNNIYIKLITKGLKSPTLSFCDTASLTHFLSQFSLILQTSRSLYLICSVC